MRLKDNEKYTLVKEWDKYDFYVPAQATDYHVSRLVEATNFQIYASSGATKDVLNEVMDEIILRCNTTDNIKTIKTDIASLASSVKYRLSYPIDEHCSIRMGCMLTFVEYEVNGSIITEEPDKPSHHAQQIKEKLAMEVPDLYAFFLTLGISNIPAYKPHLDILNDTEYFLKRKAALMAFVPSKAELTITTTGSE